MFSTNVSFIDFIDRFNTFFEENLRIFWSSRVELLRLEVIRPVKF